MLLTFTSTDWNFARTVTVTGVADLVTDGDIGYSIVLGSAVSVDLAYAGIDPADVALINTDGVNDPPLVAGPGVQATAEDAALVFSVANGNAISISDPDLGPGALLVSLSASQGTLTLSTMSGLSFVSGDGSADASMTFTGALAAVNAALDRLWFAPLPDFSGAASLSVAVDDQGGSGSGGPRSDNQTISIGVMPMNDAPNGALAITGTPAEGQILTADASGVSDPDGMGAFAYQWLRFSDGGASFLS